MIRQDQEKGFTLLEAVIALLLFALLMESLWGFFATTYINYVKFDRKASDIDHSRAVSDFIREEIRLAEEVTITVTTDGGATSTEIYGDLMETNLAISGELQSIQLYAAKAPSGKKKRQLKLEEMTSSADGGGKYRLVYQAPPHSGTKSLISGEIESIQVTREANSNLLEFECTFHPKGETLESQKIKINFTESLHYKERYTR